QTAHCEAPMLITTLGTSHGNHTMTRYNSATLVTTSGASYLVDCGEPVAASLERSGKWDPPIRAVFVTHMHADHVGGLAELTNMYFKRGEQDDRDLTLCLPAEAVEAIRTYLTAIYQAPELRPGRLSLQGVEPGPCYRDERLRATAFFSGHLAGQGEIYQSEGHPNRGQSFSYLLELEGRRVGFSGDLPPKFDYLGELLSEPLDLLVMEMTHIKPENVLPFIADKPIGKLLLTHIHDPWHGAGENVLRDMCFHYLPFPFVIAYDGMELEL
ncbi:MAG: MBL fold metallo-hydrolase, partial [Armatimonadetes bacterium]|nr:MBL fold metallo-hydrolase [Armatimonadota bacterium]